MYSGQSRSWGHATFTMRPRAVAQWLVKHDWLDNWHHDTHSWVCMLSVCRRLGHEKMWCWLPMHSVHRGSRMKVEAEEEMETVEQKKRMRRKRGFLKLLTTISNLHCKQTSSVKLYFQALWWMNKFNPVTNVYCKDNQHVAQKLGTKNHLKTTPCDSRTQARCECIYHHHSHTVNLVCHVEAVGIVSF